MSSIFGSYGPAHPGLGKLVFHATKPLLAAFYASQQFYQLDSPYGRDRAAKMREKLSRSETIYLMGITTHSHNSGVALIAVSLEGGIRLICNEEEERYTGIKHYSGYPFHSVEALKLRLIDLKIKPTDIHACLASWRYMDCIPLALRLVAEHAPDSFTLLNRASSPNMNQAQALQAVKTPMRLGKQLGLDVPLPIIALRHHDNHAYFAYGVSPFYGSHDPVMVTVLDGYGDDAAISLYVAKENQLECLRNNHSLFDSLGMLYSLISSTQGGWTTLSSEGRYMGASAWGNGDRLTNPYYRQLRQLVYFGNGGEIYLNRAMANWHNSGELNPYNAALKEILGEPIPPEKMWNPDAVLRVEEISHLPITQERLDKAAAAQLLFEDVLFHIVDGLIRKTGSSKLVMAGGTALNCIANMRLLEHFNEDYYQRYFHQRTPLRLWVPPTPGDAGVAMGAAYNFAMSHGVPVREKLCHAFYCGMPPTGALVRQALTEVEEIAYLPLGLINSSQQRDSCAEAEGYRVADFVAFVVARDGILGLFQGAAEMGPRALGHRSIVANPCNRNTLENINKLVKFRERVRPLAPMATLEAAKLYFELSPGASDDDYNAYNYMILTTRARPKSYRVIPAVIHHDGTSRVQIVSENIDPFTYAYLKAMGRRVGVEISVNTSLNVGSPIVQTPAQALEALKRSKGMTGLIMIGSEGEAFLAWHNVHSGLKDAGKTLLCWYREWQWEVEAELISISVASS